MAATLLHKAPFVRLLAATATGIVLQRYLQFPAVVLLIFFAASLVCIALYSATGLRRRFQFAALNGALFIALFASFGAGLVWLQNVRNHPQWIGHRFSKAQEFVVTVQEPLIEKPASFKAEASLEAAISGDTVHAVEGRLLLYFRKDSALPPLLYGSRLLLRKPLQEIKNAGNPGSFDYKSYCLYQGITHQVFLSTDDFVLLPGKDENGLKRFVFDARAWVVNLLRRYVRGEKEQGLAEALLIGYKDDLDKNLVQAYSNTGVVHIIAISGLHLGLIYALLVGLTKPLKRNRKLVWLRLLLILGSLWLFTLLAGAQPSVLRSAVMFTVIAFGEVALRRTNIFNTLACSAMVLLCLNPFWLWDVGFQLSYTAVLGIVLFFRPVYHWASFGNKVLDFFWSLTAVTLAAQVLTLPISVYHFHQLPLLFLLANFMAVPLSSLILLGEIALCGLGFLPPLANLVGAALTEAIVWMNGYVERLDGLPFAVWNFLSISVAQTALLLVLAVAGCWWLMEKGRRFARLALSAFAGFMLLRAASFAEAVQQQKLIVYNVPKHSAMDVISGRHYAFVGDSALLYDDYLRNFHLQPARIRARTEMIEGDAAQKSFRIAGKQVVVLDEALPLARAHSKPVIDLLVLAKNPKLFMNNVAAAFAIKQVVIDGSVPVAKAARWKKDLDSLRIPCHNVAEEGAFVLDL